MSPARLFGVALMLVGSCRRPVQRCHPPAGWSFSSARPSDYCASVDGDEQKGGHKSVKLGARSPSPVGEGALFQTLDATPHRGKRVRVSANVKAGGVRAGAGLFARVERAQGPTVEDDMRGRPVRGTGDWQGASIVLDVPDDAKLITLGAWLEGPGSFWVDDIALAEVDQSTPATVETPGLSFRNGDFEASPPLAGWGLDGMAAADFEAAIDAIVTHGGRASARLRPRVPSPGPYATLMQTASAAPFRGGKVRVSAWVKGEGVAGRGDLWARLQGVDSPPDGPGLGVGGCKLSGSFDWRPCEMTLAVPANAVALNVGLGLGGAGTLWLDDMRVEGIGEAPRPAASGSERPAFAPRPPTDLCPPYTGGPHRWGFEGESPLEGWFLRAEGASAYDWAVDKAQHRSGLASGRLRARVAMPSGFGATRIACVEGGPGRRVRLVAWVKGDELAAFGGPWAYVVGPESGTTELACRFEGTFDWRRCEITFEVKAPRTEVLLGVALRSSGTIWVDDMGLEDAEPDAPLATPVELPASLRNADFEGG